MLIALSRLMPLFISNTFHHLHLFYLCFCSGCLSFTWRLAPWDYIDFCPLLGLIMPHGSWRRLAPISAFWMNSQKGQMFVRYNPHRSVVKPVRVVSQYLWDLPRKKKHEKTEDGSLWFCDTAQLDGNFTALFPNFLPTGGYYLYHHHMCPQNKWSWRSCRRYSTVDTNNKTQNND